MVRGHWKTAGGASAAAALLVIGLFLLVPPVASDGHEEPDPEPWVMIHSWSGVVSAAAAWHVEPPVAGCIVMDTPVYAAKTCGGIRFGTSPNGEVSYAVAETVETIVVELDWEPSGPLSSLQLDTLCPEVPRAASGAVLDLEHPCYFAPLGGSSGPIQIRVDRDHWETHGYNPLGDWAARVFASANTFGTQEMGLGAGYAVQQPFELRVTLFHIEPAPDGYTAFP